MNRLPASFQSAFTALKCLLFAVFLSLAGQSRAANPAPVGPDFPLFMYGSGYTPIIDYTQYGWNILQEYSANTVPRINGHLQACAAINETAVGTLPGKTTPLNASTAQKWIQAVSGNANLSWWNMPEELLSWGATGPGEMSLLADYCAWTRAFDPQRRPNFEVCEDYNGPGNFATILQSADIIGAEAYPEWAGGGKHATIRYRIQDCAIPGILNSGRTIGTNYLAGQKLPIAVLYVDENVNATPSMPTPEQTYHDFWSAIASGAMGIAVFDYWDGTHKGPQLLECINKVNLAASQVTGPENLGDVILNGVTDPNVGLAILSGPTQTDTISGNAGTKTYPSINVRCKVRNGNVYVIAVNSTDQPVTASISNLPSTDSSANVLFQSRTVALSGGSLSDAFPAWGVNIYKMTLKSGTPPASPTGLAASLPTAISGSNISLSWNASSGATIYNVKRASVSGGPYMTVATGLTGTTYTDFGLDNQNTYYYTVSAINNYGESASSAQASATTQLWTRIDDSEIRIIYDNMGGNVARNVGDYKNTLHEKNVAGASAQYNFYGTGVRYVTPKESNAGNVDVYLDGVLQTTVNCYSATRQTQQAVYTATGLPLAVHTIKIVNNDGTYTRLDGFDVCTSAPLTFVEVASSSPGTENGTAITGTTATLSALAKSSSYAASSLTYTWTATTVPDGGTTPTFSPNGTNAAQNSTVTIGTDTPGLYGFTVTVADPGGNTATSSVYVTSTAPGQITSWKFDDGSGTVAVDSINAHNGTVNGATWTSGIKNGALAFNGSNNSVTFGTGPSLSGATDFTVSAWIKTTATALSAIIQQRDSSSTSSSAEYKLWMNANGTLNFDVYGNAAGGGSARQWSNSLTTTKTVNDGQWHCVTAVRSGATGSIYIDGNLEKSLNGTVRLLTSNIGVVVGADTRSTGNCYFNGTIDDVRIYNKALSAAEVGALADLGPSVATTASATPNPVTGATANLSVLGGHAGGEGNLTYTWAATTFPAGAAPTFSANGTNAAKNVTATFSKAGTYTLTATIADSYNKTVTSSVNVTVNTKPFTFWQSQVFGSNANNPAIAGPMANPSGDGTPNLLKFAYNLNPLVPSTAGLPSVSKSGGNLVLTYSKNNAATDLTYSVLQSTDVSTWTTATPTLTTISDVNGTSTIQASVPINGASKLMLRLKVTQQ